MTDHHAEIGLGLRMDGSTHFNDLTNLVTSTRHGMINAHNAAAANPDQQPHNGLTNQAQMSMAYDTSSQDTLMKHSATHAAALGDEHFGNGAMQARNPQRQSQQVDFHRSHHDEPLVSGEPQPAGLAQAFVDMNPRQTQAQKPAQEDVNLRNNLGFHVQSSDSPVTFQDHPGQEAAAQQPAQMVQTQACFGPVQAKPQPSLIEGRHQSKSYPPSPPLHSQMTPQPDLRSFEGRMNPADGRPSHRPSHSLGQAGAFMSGVHDRQLFPHSHISAPVSPAEGFSTGQLAQLLQFPGPRQEASLNMADHPHMFDHGAHHITPRHSGHFSRSCAPSVRSASPSVSMASTSMTSISPLSSAHINHDSSFTSQEASFDSLSNAATGSFSRASSTSEDFFGYQDLGSLGLRQAKQKKKLRNIDRKRICDYSVANPAVKQDAIASKFGIERSTVSKILKQKEKWLAIDPESSDARIAKHRAVKFPAVEDRLTIWVAELKAKGEPIRDSEIRQEALRIAQRVGLGEDKFKASGGWIEKFRERNSIPKPQSAEPASSTRDASKAAVKPEASSGEKAAASLAPQQPTDVAGKRTDAETQSRPPRRPAARSTKAKTTSQKRVRDEGKTQEILGMSPLNHDMARMHFQNASPVGSPQGPAFFGPGLPGNHPATQHPMQCCNLVFDAHGMPGHAHPTEGDEESDRKRRRAVQEFQGNQAAMGLGPAIAFQFPQNAMPSSSSQLNMFGQPPQTISQADISPQRGSPRSCRNAGKDSAESSSRGRPRRGKARVSGADHAPQTPSPLSMSPADGMGETDLRGMTVEEAQQLTMVTMERIRALQSSGDKSSIVTAEQAQQSLDLILRFLHEQPEGFMPADHVDVFNHLQASIEQKIRDRSMDAPPTESSSSGPEPTIQSASPHDAGVSERAGEQ